MTLYVVVEVNDNGECQQARGPFMEKHDALLFAQALFDTWADNREGRDGEGEKAENHTQDKDASCGVYYFGRDRTCMISFEVIELEQV